MAAASAAPRVRVHTGGTWVHAWSKHAADEAWKLPHWHGGVPKNKAEFGHLVQRVVESAQFLLTANEDIKRTEGNRRYWVHSESFPYFRVLVIETNVASGYNYQVVTAFPVLHNVFTHIECASAKKIPFSAELWVSATKRFVYAPLNMEPSASVSATPAVATDIDLLFKNIHAAVDALQAELKTLLRS